MTTTVLLKDVLHCPDMGLTLVSIGKLTTAGYKVLFRGSTCKIFDSKDRVIGQVNMKNRLYRVDHDVMINVGIAGEAREVLTVEELHRRMGHIALEAAKKMVSSGATRGIEVDPSTVLQSCDSCEYAKAMHKPIRKTHMEARASRFGDEIHLDVWGPSPVQTPGHKEYYVSFTDDHTRWTHLQLLAAKDEVFRAYKAFEAGRCSTLGSKHSKFCTRTTEENTWAGSSANTSRRKRQSTGLPFMTHQNITECPSASTGPFSRGHVRCCTPVSFLKIFGERPLIMLFG